MTGSLHIGHIDDQPTEKHAPSWIWVVVFKIFGIFTPKIGEDEPILTNIFQMGWFNHHLENGLIWRRFWRWSRYLKVPNITHKVSKDDPTLIKSVLEVNVISWG